MQINREELIKRLMLADASFLTFREKTVLEKNLDSPDALAIMSIDDISSMVKRTFGKAHWDAGYSLDQAAKNSIILEKLGINFAFYDSEDYPAMFKEMTDPPYAVFYRGDIKCLKNSIVSVVGTRRATNDGRKAAFDFGKDASDNGTVVVSGLAFGIDIASHKGALSGALGKTCAVLPSGIDKIVPGAHIKEAAKIIEKGGCVLSEYTPLTEVQAFRYIQRNRLIAALSPATVVIQAPAGSGAMTTASLALDYNRYVFFSQVCLGKESELLYDVVEGELKKTALIQKNKEKLIAGKLNNSPKNYIQEGAPVIKNYAEYTEYMHNGSEPLKKVNTDGQLDLFKADSQKE